ncbi:TonB-dependent receptor plug domain-containing protein [Gluconobacter sphaericus]|uniref:TonB-dependent receptor plug domain-containing protein n=1 Tax=Gluconobacter sphaericus TaxID=574987 RepID=UPI002013258B|nr:Plug domain-containing protein [Gluconobacter sphaericus]
MRRPEAASLRAKTAHAQKHALVVKSASETISVVGSGSTRQMQSVSRRDMQNLVPGTTPLKAVGNLPGVQFSSSDPLGIDLWSQSFYMHGFTSDQLGFTVDGIPLGGQGYESYNGVPVNRTISNENIIRTDVSQGAGSLDTPSTSNLGGTVRFYSDDPLDRMGGRISQTFGSYDAFRTFVRFDSGKLNPSGTKFYVSYDRRAEDKWLGGGFTVSANGECQTGAAHRQPYDIQDLF